MRLLRTTVLMLLLSFSLCVSLRAQKSTPCKAPETAPGQTTEQQEAAASGYLAGCKSATAPNAHALQTKTGDNYSLDSIVPELPAHQSKWSVDDYYTWLDESGCSYLLQTVRTKVGKRSVRAKKVYLAAVLKAVNENNGQCD